MSTVSPQKAFCAVLRAAGCQVRKVSNSSPEAKAIEANEKPKKRILKLAGVKVPNWTSNWSPEILTALRFPTEVPHGAKVDDIVGLYNDRYADNDLVGNFNILLPDERLDDVSGARITGQLAEALDQEEAVLLLPLFKVSSVLSFKSRSELPVQALAQHLLSTVVVPHSKDFLLTTQPHPDNRLLFNIGDFQVVSIVDVALWDYERRRSNKGTGLVMFGNVEAKDPRNNWNWGQLAGQLIANGSHNFAMDYLGEDGSVSAIAMVLQGWRVWIARASFHPSYFEDLTCNRCPTEAPDIRIWGGPKGASLLIRDQRRVVFNLLRARAHEVKPLKLEKE